MIGFNILPYCLFAVADPDLQVSVWDGGGGGGDARLASLRETKRPVSVGRGERGSPSCVNGFPPVTPGIHQTIYS